MDLSGDEFAVLMIALLVGASVSYYYSTMFLHRLFLRANPGVGVIRLSVLASMLWMFFVLNNYADPSVTFIYKIFYLLLGYCVLVVFGYPTSQIFGVSLTVDVYQRRNFGAALIVAACILAVGMIYGGSLWGEADADGDDEGGWWIPMTFFLMGWFGLLITTGIFLWRESGNLRRRVAQERNLSDARATASYIACVAIPLTEAVAGDFFGWTDGILSFFVILLMLAVRELLQPARAEQGPVITEPEKTTPENRMGEAMIYLALAVIGWLISRMAYLLWR